MGLKCYNFATGSSGAYHWADRLNIIDAYAPKLTYVSLGGNDIFHSKTASEYTTAMNAILTKLASHGDIIMGYYFPINNSTYVAKSEEFRTIAKKSSYCV